METRRGAKHKGSWGFANDFHPIMVDDKIRWLLIRDGRLGQYVYINREYRSIHLDPSGQYYTLGEVPAYR